MAYRILQSVASNLFHETSIDRLSDEIHLVESQKFDLSNQCISFSSATENQQGYTKHSIAKQHHAEGGTNLKERLVC